MVLAIAVVMTMAAAVSAPLATRWLGRHAGWLYAVVLAVLTAALAGYAPAVLVRGEVVEHALTWMPQLGVTLHLRLDGLALLFALLVTGIGALVMAYAARYFSAGRQTGFYFFMLAFAAAMVGLVLADDVVALYVFWELTTICSFFLIGISGPEASRPAVRTYLVTALGGLALLAAVVILAVRTGTTRLSAILADPVWQQDPGLAALVAVLVAAAVFTKSAQFPFHYWLPDAMVASTPVSTYLHAATMVKAGIFLAMRFTPALGEHPVWHIVLITGGLVTAVLGALFALQRHDLKELLAYSTVSQLGLLVAVIGIGTPTALAAAAGHTLAHALFKSALFMAVGVIDHETGTRDVRELGGLWRAMPVTAAVTTLAAASMAGLPPLLGFVTKESLYAAYLQAPAGLGAVVAVGAVAASALTFAYAFRLAYGAFGGPRRGRRGQDPPAMVAAVGLPAVAGLALGPAVPVLDPLAQRIVLDTTGAVYDPHLALWHGINAPMGMSVAALGLGAVLARRRAVVDRALRRRLFPATGPGVFEAVHDWVVRLGARTGDLTRSGAPAPYLAAPVLLVLVLAAATVSVGPELGEPVLQGAAALDWLLVALTGAAVLGAVSTRSRLGALVLVGVAGFTTAAWLLVLGGVDLALTQLLVEVLTVALAALVLRRLPRLFHPVRVRRKVLAGVLAVAAGATAGLAAFAMTGRRQLSPVGEYFLTHAEEETGGTNVVNTILVDYRPFDTLGEIIVLGVAGLAVIAVLDNAELVRGRIPAHVRELSRNAVFPATDNTVVIRDVAFWISPALAAVSLWLLLRGHHAPGGGFVAALIGGAALALGYLAAPHASLARIHMPARWVIAAGFLIALGTGLLGFVDGSFLRPLHAEIPLPWGGEYHVTTSLIFDLGVYLAVLGTMLAAFQRLGAEDDVVHPPLARRLPRRHRPIVATHQDAAATHQDAPTGGVR